MAQPHKGNRHQTTVRIPERLHGEIEERRGGSGYRDLNAYVIAMLEKAAGAGLFPDPLTPGQDRLPLSA
jgi:hypothetical protein